MAFDSFAVTLFCLYKQGAEAPLQDSCQERRLQLVVKADLINLLRLPLNSPVGN